MIITLTSAAGQGSSLAGQAAALQGQEATLQGQEEAIAGQGSSIAGHCRASMDSIVQWLRLQQGLIATIPLKQHD